MHSIIKPVYYCDTCSKKALTKKTIAEHEITCMGNPANRPACFEDCKHFEKPERGQYHCTKFHKFLHTKRAELKGYSFGQESELMPMECAGYEAEQQEQASYLIGLEPEYPPLTVIT